MRRNTRLALLALALFGCAGTGDRSFTLVVLPDTQCYADTRLHQSRERWGRDLREYFFTQTSWIRDRIAGLNIRFVVHEGDITQTDFPEEWEIARRAMATLDGHVPYCLCLGNHDMGYRKTETSALSYDTAVDRGTKFNDYFPRSFYEKWPSFGGTFDETHDNSYYFFSQGSLEFLVVSLEFKPRDEVLEWASGVVATHPGHRVIVVTHAYLDADNRRITSDKYAIEGNSGEEIWQKFVSRHRNIFLVLCGHRLGEGRLTSTGIHGNRVHQLLCDYQGLDDGGKSWLRYMTFYPSEDRIRVFTYNPQLDQHREDPKGRFDLAYDMTGRSEAERARVECDYELANVLPPLDDEDDPRAAHRRQPGELPFVVEPFEEHVRGEERGPEARVEKLVVAEGGLHALTEAASFERREDGSWARAASPRADPGFVYAGRERRANARVTIGETRWLAADDGLYRQALGPEPGAVERHTEYGTNGPLATRVTDLVADTRGALWCATPLGLSLREPDGSWRQIRGRDGLPCEDLTCLAIDGADRLWIGTTRGAVHYRPHEDGRQWFYRAGQRYLPHDRVLDVAVSPDGRSAYFATPAGLSRIDTVTTTLREKAETIEKRIEERHRRLGLVADCRLEDARRPEVGHSIGDDDNDGLWTAYHVAAMSLAFAQTGDEAARRSARRSMHALVMLQEASGTPGLVARSVVSREEGEKKSAQWRPTPDGERYWKSDTSSDEIDGHYLAFYTYWEHIARFDPAESAVIVRQIRELTDYLLHNDYLLIDWDGERTLWGFWSPELLNGSPEHYLENGLNSLQLLSFLKVAHHITGDARYKEHYDSLICEHGYLGNVLLEKKLFPDEDNHSDDQLAYVAWYPILQLERDPRVREALHRALRRHYRILAAERSSFFNFVTATIDPDYVDIEAGVENLRRIPTDRRRWRMENSQRADVTFDPRIDRFGRRQLLEVLPADERDFAKWNRNPYLPDGGGDGRVEDDGAAFLLPYWLGRYHGFIEEP